MQRKHQSADVILNQQQIEKVRRDLEDREFWHELTPEQQEGHRPSYYNAMIHKRCGWSTVANAIIKHQMPQLSEDMSADDDIRQHIESVKKFCCDLLTWLKRFAEEASNRKECEKKHPRTK